VQLEATHQRAVDEQINTHGRTATGNAVRSLSMLV
jgi:hypothetical protein